MTEQKIGGEGRPSWVAVVGSGPSAFYAADALFKSEGFRVRVDMYERLPTPFGLARGGVAPDHQKIKAVTRMYDRTAQHPAFRFFGNVDVGYDVQVTELESLYDCVVLAVGAPGERSLGITGEDAGGVHTATEFVGWYNGHPDFRDRVFSLDSARRVAVVGNGNVAVDVARILAQQPSRLASTDIADYALTALQASQVEEVLLIGRRGPAQAAFSPPEIKEIAELDDVDLVIDPAEVELDEASLRWLEHGAGSSAKRNIEFLTEQSRAAQGNGSRRVRCLFLASPVELLSRDGRVSEVILEENELYLDDRGTPRPRGTGERTTELVDHVFTAVGYHGIPIPGVPFDEKSGVIPNTDGRVLPEPGATTPLPGRYVVGWAKRGPTGLIGTNNKDSKGVMKLLREDMLERESAPRSTDHGDAIVRFLRENQVDFVSYEDWLLLDAHEVRKGDKLGKVRDKATSVDEMMSIIRAARVNP